MLTVLIESLSCENCTCDVHSSDSSSFCPSPLLAASHALCCCVLLSELCCVALFRCASLLCFPRLRLRLESLCPWTTVAAGTVAAQFCAADPLCACRITAAMVVRC